MTDSIKRFHRAKVGGAVYWFVADSQADAAKILADNCVDEIDDGNVPQWSVMTDAEASKIMARDGADVRKPLTEYGSGAWFCSEYD